jgi:NADPH:quinone reductase-like Zn-dependent oxidoreductase
MRAVVLTSSTAQPLCTDFADPDPFPGREPLSLIGAGLHQVVKSLASGRHYGSDGAYPLVPGVDAVAERQDGTLVYTGYSRSPWGTMAETLATPFDLPLPDGADPLAIAAGMNPAMAGFMPLMGHLQRRGELGTVLVLGATGMAGRAAVQSAIALGADRVIAVGRDEGSLAYLRQLGVETVALGADASALAAAVKSSAPSLVLDFVWGPVAEAAFSALGRRGMGEDDAEISYVQIGSLAGAEAGLPSSLLRSRRITISGSGAGSLSMSAILEQLPLVMHQLANGTITVPYTAYPMERIAEAWKHRGRNRVVVTP